MFLDKYRHYVLGLLRIVLGYAFVLHGTAKFFHDRWERLCRTCLVNGRGGCD